MTKPKQHFQEQGGIATMDPIPFRRWVISKLMSAQANESRMQAKRNKAERHRKKKQQPHVIEYFHQVDDAYSYLALQVLEPLLTRYEIELRCYLVSEPTGPNSAEPELLSKLGLTDAKRVGPHYGLFFPDVSDLPSCQNTVLAQTILAAQDAVDFPSCALAVSAALWQNDQAKLTQLADHFGVVNQQAADQKLAQGNQRRAKLKHYASAMFYYAGEWYWGVDRLYHLEQRLNTLGADKTPTKPYLIERPKIETDGIMDSGNLTLEVYASLRSPYTAIVFDRAVQLAKETGVNCVIRPVLPMVMRGVPATKEKGLYILFDTAREARAAGVPYGKVCDPIGQPVRHGYALYQWACKFDKGTAFISNFLRAAFAEGVNTNKKSGLRYVIEETALDWQQAQHYLNTSDWEQELESNRLTMYEFGLWGVPSFRLLDQHGNEVLALWGQDRLWLFAVEIKRLLSEQP